MQDIHAHLYWESFDEDRDVVLERAKAAGITEILVVGTSIEENTRVLDLVNKHEQLFASVGVHPNVFREPVEGDWIQQLEVQAENEKVVAIGECGLDYSESHGLIREEQKIAQKAGFLQQLSVAKNKKLPIIVHCRATSATSDDAYWDLFEILKESAEQLPAIVLHCYMGSVVVTEEFLKIENVHFSFTGNITYPIKKEIRGGNFDVTEVVKLVPLERLFVETDCPFLAPQSKRGKRNEPGFVMEVAHKIADLRRVSVKNIEYKTTENFNRVFGV